MTQYQPKIGDKVRVTVGQDIFGDPMYPNKVYTVEEIDEFDGTVWLDDYDYNVHRHQVQPYDAGTLARAVIDTWRRGFYLATADRSEHWAQIIDWMQQMNTLIEQLEREVNNG